MFEFDTTYSKDIHFRYEKAIRDDNLRRSFIYGAIDMLMAGGLMALHFLGPQSSFNLLPLAVFLFVLVPVAVGFDLFKADEKRLQRQIDIHFETQPLANPGVVHYVFNDDFIVSKKQDNSISMVQYREVTRIYKGDNEMYLALVGRRMIALEGESTQKQEFVDFLRNKTGKRARKIIKDKK